MNTAEFERPISPARPRGRAASGNQFFFVRGRPKPGEGTADGVWVFLARLISRTLLSLSLIGDYFLVASGESFNTANPDDPRLKFARAGWSPLVQGAARLVQFDATCRLCPGSPEGPTADTQEHFTKCPALASAWSDAADAAITRALLSSTLQPLAPRRTI